MSLSTRAELQERNFPLLNRLLRPGWMWVLYLAPALLTGAYIRRYGVNAPVEDEWSLPYMYYYAKATIDGFLGFFWAPHNEHRVVVPKLIWALTAFPTHWNLVLNMFLTLGVLSAAFVAMVRTALRDRSGNNRGLPASIFGSALLLFSLVHWDTWLFAWQLTFVLTISLAIAAILVLVHPGFPPQARLWIAVALCFLSTLSSAQGTLAWLVILPAVFFAFPERRQGLIGCLSVLVCFGITMGIYYINYHPAVAFKPDPYLIFQKSAQVLLFWLALVGAPLAQSFSHTELMAEGLGAASLIAFAIAVFGSLRSGMLRDTLVWSLIGIYGVATDVMIAVGRAGWGAGIAATMSRYMINTVLIQAATLFLLAKLASRVTAWQSFFWTTLVAIVGLELASYPGGIEKARELHQSRTMAAEALVVMPYIDPASDRLEKGLLFPLYPVIVPGASIRPPAELLSRIRFRFIEHNAVFEERPPFCGCIDTPILQAGKPFPMGKSEPLAVSGWALYPGKAALPKMVFLSTGDRRVFVGGALVGNSFSRPDVASFMKNPALVRAGWSTEIPATLLPTGEFELKAWVYDRDHSTFLRLSDCTGPKHIRRDF